MHVCGPGKETVMYKPKPKLKQSSYPSACSYLACRLHHDPLSFSPWVKQEQHIRTLQMLKAEGNGKKSFWRSVSGMTGQKWTAINNSLSRIIWCTGTLSFSRCWTQLGTWDKTTAFTLLNKEGVGETRKKKHPCVNKNLFPNMHTLRHTHQFTYRIYPIFIYVTNTCKHHTYTHYKI